MVGGSTPLVHPKEEDRMDLLTVMWRVAFAVGGIVCGFLGIVFMLTAAFMTAKKLAITGVRGIKYKHRAVVFVLGYLLLCLGVYLMYLLFRGG